MSDDWNKIFEDMERDAFRTASVLAVVLGVSIVLLLAVGGL